MVTVHKYRLFEDLAAAQDTFVLQLPHGAEILTVQRQGFGEGLFLWARVNTDRPLEERRFRFAGTGHPLGEVLDHIATVQFHAGGLVFHLFEMAP